MNRSPARARSLLQPAARRPARLSALFLLVLTAATAACGVRPPRQTDQGPTAIVSQSDIDCVAPALPAPAGGCVEQDAATGISLRVANAYADVTSTVVQLETTNTAGYLLAIGDAQLALPSGRTFQVTGGISGASYSFTIYDPVSPADFAPLAHFVTTAHFTEPVSFGRNPLPSPPVPPPPWLNHLDRIALSVPFALALPRLGGYTFQQPPIVEQKIGVQVQWLQVSPAGTAFYGPAGGASIELLFSGLPADMELLSFIRLVARNSIAGGTQGDYGPGRVELHIPGMSVSTPAFTVLQHPQWPHDSQGRSSDPTVGAGGTVRLEVSYQGSGVPTGQPATVSISQIQLLTGGIDGNSGNPSTLPAYQITLPLS
jgi:hypothetical protein